MKVLAIFTCFNRKEKSVSCIRTLVKGNPNCQFTFVVSDDNSTDGTREILTEMKREFDIHILKGTGNLFYSGGMRAGMEYGLSNLENTYDYMLMMNDDVEFYDLCIEKMAKQSYELKGAVIVGVTCDDNGNISYGGIKYIRGVKYRRLALTEWKTRADTFNANCVLIPYKVFQEVGIMDSAYIHSLGDFDYGLAIKRAGYYEYISREYIGICNNNSNKNTWADTSLSIYKRIKKKESIKGDPIRQWFYFLKKNFGIKTACISSVTPYIRILLHK